MCFSETLALLNRVMATITSTDVDNEEQVKKAIFYDDLWSIKPFKPNAYWFLKTGKIHNYFNLRVLLYCHFQFFFILTEEAEEAIDLNEEPKVVVQPPVGEICLLSSPSIILSLEMEIGNDTLPVLVMQASLTGTVKDWSSEVSVESATLKIN